MGHKIAIDFGTTNSVVARWIEDGEVVEILPVKDFYAESIEERPPVIPSMVYVHDGKTGQVSLGQQVRAKDLDEKQDNRLFRNFKRGIVSTPAPAPRDIDGESWADRDAGRSFNRTIIESLPVEFDEIDQLVLTAPVASFEGYLQWLNGVIEEFPAEKIRIVDESTAAALGYAVTNPGAPVLVFDFGGGTLDLSLVQLPESREKTGGFIKRLMKGGAKQNAARVIAKAGRVIGGSDIDQWLLQDVLKREGLSNADLGNHYATLLTRCEEAKIHLSNQESAVIEFDSAGKSHRITVTREELEALLEKNDFYTALRRVVDKVMYVSRQRGIYKEDIGDVLMVGGTSLMPSVQKLLGQYFSEMAVRADKPFTAVAEGALQLAAGYGLDDYLIHSYGLRFLNAEGKHEYDEIIPMGSAYPTETPVEVVLSAAHADQKQVEFVIGEIDTDAVSMIEVKYEDGQAVFVAQAASSDQQIIPLNEKDALEFLAELDPAGEPGEDRLRAEFSIDDRRQLRLKVTDLKNGNVLVDDVAVVTLR